MQAIGDLYPAVQCYSPGRGEIYENIIWTGGDPLPSKSDLDLVILSKKKDIVWEQIKTERDRRKEINGYKVGNFWFHSDTTSRIQYLALVMLGQSMPNNIMWKTMSGEFVQMTPTLAQQVFQAAMTFDITIFTVAEQKKVEAWALNDPMSYNYLTGWPLGYGE